MEGTVEVDLREIFAAMLRRWWLVLICVVAGAALMLGITAFITPQYTASVYMYVDNNSSGGGGITSSELTVAKQLVNTYINIIKRDPVLEKASDLIRQRTGQHYTPDALRYMLTAEPVEQTEIFTVQVTHSDPVMAAQIANAVAEVSPDLIAKTLRGSSVVIIEEAKAPHQPVSPNVGRNLLLGALGGLVVIVLGVCLQVILDKRIKSEEELVKISSAPVLGNIPDFLDEGKTYYRADDEPRKPVSK